MGILKVKGRDLLENIEELQTNASKLSKRFKKLKKAWTIIHYSH